MKNRLVVLTIAMPWSYGSLASLIIPPVRLYLCGNILLLGAAVSHTWAIRRTRQTIAETTDGPLRTAAPTCHCEKRHSDPRT